ncbi:MAG: Ig-like domain-containing protein [Terracidiphilus sp.]
MFNRFCFGALLLAGILFPLTSCGSGPSLTSIVISPASVTVSLAPQGVPQGSNQYTAIGYYTHPDHPAETKNITSQVTWASSSTQVATVSSTGLATATGFTASGAWTGNTTITASAPGFNGTIVSNPAVFAVTPCTACVSISTDVISVTVIPATQTVASLNVPIQYEAVGTTSTGLTEALGNFVGLSWVSSVSSVATINAGSGLATTAGSGTTTITAIFKNPDQTAAEGSATLTVAPTGSPEPLTALTVAPNAQTALAIGQTAQFLAIATTGSGTSVNLTNQTATVGGQTIKAATWTSSNPSVATINSATGLATALSAGATVITAIATNPNDGSVVTGTATYTVTVPTSASSEPLTGLSIIPSAQTALAVNQTAHFIAIATTGSGGSVNLTNQTATVNGTTIAAAVWSSSNPAVATVDPATGIATALSAGVTAITAIATNPGDKTVVTATAVFTVTVPNQTEAYVSLAIVPASQTATSANQTAQFIAIGTTGTGSTVNLTNLATWSSSSTAVATINPATGLATAVANGAVAITAVVRNPSNDGTVVSGSASFTVAIAATPEPLLSLAILPGSQTVASAGQTTQFLAIGTFSASSPTPGSQNMANVPGYTVAWYSSNPSVATVCSVGGLCPATPGLVTAVGPGTAAITAIATNTTDKSGASAAASFTVSGPAPEPISALSIFPASQSITLPLPGSPLQTASFIALGTNGSTGIQTQVSSPTVNWSSTNPLVATIDSSGVATALSQGTTTITAIATNADHSVQTATATLTVAGVASEPLLSLTVSPGSEQVAYPGQTGQFIAIGTFTPTATQPVTQNLTATASWTSSNPAVATVCSVGGLCPATPGLVTAVGQGTTVIIATAQNPDHSLVTASATFGVVNAPAEPVASLVIVPPNQSIATGQTAQVIALGTNGATGLQSDVTTAPNLTWTSSVPAVATVGLHTGLITSVAAGTTSIVAEYTNPPVGANPASVVTASAVVTVTAVVSINGDVISVEVLPADQLDLFIDQTTQFIAIGTSSLFPYTSDVTDCFQTTPPANPAPCNGGSTSWASSNVDVATINNTGTPGPTTGGLGAPAGLATLLFEGSTAITATYTNLDGSIATGVATLHCDFGQCVLEPPPQPPVVTLTVFGAGNNTGPSTAYPNDTWLVTAPSATGTSPCVLGVSCMIHCGPGDTTPGGPVCVGSYPVGSTVTLTTDEAVGTGTFGGWASGPSTITEFNNATPPVLVTVPNPSYCTPLPLPSTPNGTNTCTITSIDGDDNVVAIFDN